MNKGQPLGPRTSCKLGTAQHQRAVAWDGGARIKDGTHLHPIGFAAKPGDTPGGGGGGGGALVE